MNTYSIAENFSTIGDFGTSISREEFEKHFRKTAERVTFTFNGWDGKSYDGESRTARVYRTDFPGFEACRYIKVGKGVHLIWEDKKVLDRASGKENPSALWQIDVRKAER